uniref:Uncharacterized protein n=1 Tax=Arundo donax TaxID=35708 RepID=A0A0A8Z4P0_ARUDO
MAPEFGNSSKNCCAGAHPCHNLGMQHRTAWSAAEVRSTILAGLLEVKPSHHGTAPGKATPGHHGSSLNRWWSLLSLGPARHHR